MANQSEKLVELVNQMPDPDDRGMYCTNMDKTKIETAIAEIHKGGRGNVLGIIDMLVEPGKGDDVKAHYALHCLGLHICNTSDEKARRQFGDTLASQLGGNRPKGVQAYLIQELQSFGGKEALEKLNAVAGDKDLAQPAVMALEAIQRTH
jgi:hypothetical protein